jgi:hypothetical protein
VIKYIIDCEAYTGQFRRQLFAEVDENGQISAFISSYGIDNPDGIEREQTNDYKKVIDFYTNCIEIMYSQEEQDVKPPPADFDDDDRIDGCIFITVQDMKTMTKTIKCFFRTVDGFWYKLVNESSNKSSIVPSSAAEMRLIFYSAINSERFIDAA